MVDIAQQTAAAARDLVLLKLKKVLTSVVRFSVDNPMTYTPNMLLRLPPERQHAVRIIESARRRWMREYNARFGDGKVRERAIMEMALKSQDNGDMLLFANGKHGVGRLDCPACDYDYVEYMGMPAQEPMCYICPECKAGVVHVKTIGEWPEGTVIDAFGTSETKPLFYRFHICDNCKQAQKILLPGQEESE